MRQIYKCVQVAQTIKIVLDTALLSEDGKLLSESETSLRKGKEFLETLNS